MRDVQEREMREKDVERKRQQRSGASATETISRREANAQRQSEARARESATETISRREANAQRQSEARARESAAETISRREANAQRQSEARARESAAETISRREANAQRQSEARARDAPFTRISRRQDAPDIAEVVDVNSDAKKYAEKLENTCVFYLCCVCAYEGGLNEMEAFTEDMKRKLHDSPLQQYFEDLIRPNTPYARCAAEELISPGIIPSVHHICKTCTGHARGKKCNPRALVRGYFCGKPPLVLAQLDSVESSMVSLINATTEVKYVKGGMKSTTDTVSYTNDVVKIAQQLAKFARSCHLERQKITKLPISPKSRIRSTSMAESQQCPVQTCINCISSGMGT